MAGAFALTILAASVLAQSPTAGKTQGASVAAITIEIFSDFQCVGCKNLHDSTIKPLIDEYVNKGKVFLINREFPLPQHPHAREAAAYATAAARLGRYHAVADALFAGQEEWSKSGRVEATATAVLTAEEARKVRALANAPEVMADIEHDLQDGRAADVRQTPTLIIAHQGKRYPVSGGVSFSILRRFLDDLLAK